MEHYKVRATELAENDLRDISRYISVELLVPVTADRIVESIQQAVLGLSHMPHRHPLVDDERLAELGYRKLHIKNYIAFFIIDEEAKTVYVERILYARRDWLHIL